MSLRQLYKNIGQMEARSNLEQDKSVLATAEAGGKTTEKLEKEIEAAQKRIERKQKRQNKFFNKLKILDFIPGGKWVKMAIKGVAAGAGAKDMKKLFSDLNIEGYGKSKWGQAQKDINKEFDKMGDKLSNPLEAMVKTMMSDFVGGKMGETFSEAFKGPDVGTAGGSKFTGDIGTKKIDVAGKAGGVGFRPDIGKFDASGGIAGKAGGVSPTCVQLTSIGPLDGGAPGAGIAVFPPKALAADLKAPAKTSPLTAGLTTSL